MAVTISGSGTIDVGGTSTSQGTVRLYEDTDNGTNYVELVAPASVASNVTLTMPTTTGTLGLASATVAWQSVQTTGFTAVSGRAYPCNTTSAAFTVTLPSSPTAGDLITLTDYAGTWNTNNLTVNPNGGKINGSTSNVVYTTTRQSLSLIHI